MTAAAFERLRTITNGGNLRAMAASYSNDIFRSVCGFVFLSLTTACSPPAIKSSDRLVAGGSLPHKNALVDETIEINRGYGGQGFGEHLLSFQLAPNNALTIMHTRRPDDEVLGKETFALSSEVAFSARQNLWMVRPTRLDGYSADVRPLGCKRQSDHDFGEIAVVFTAADEKSFGFFTLPYPASCDNAAARKAQKTIDQVLASFPRSQIAESFLALEKAAY